MKNLILQQDMEEIYSRNIDWKQLDGQTILLTGAYGMLASYIVLFILYLQMEKGIHVRLIAVVKSRDTFYQRIPEAQKTENVSVMESDLSCPLHIERKIDYIIHAASLASPQYYGICPVDVLLPNAIGNYYLLQLAREKGVKGYLFFSTGDVY